MMRIFIVFCARLKKLTIKKHTLQLRHLLPFCFILFLSGCIRQFNIKTTAYSDSKVIPNGFEKKKSFCLANASGAEDAEQNNDELQTKELEKKIALMLVNRGYSVIKGG